VLQCVAVCCSVLQCVAVCCSALQCVAVRMAMRSHSAEKSAVCCSVLQCVAVCCSPHGDAQSATAVTQRDSADGTHTHTHTHTRMRAKRDGVETWREPSNIKVGFPGDPGRLVHSGVEACTDLKERKRDSKTQDRVDMG